MDFSKESHDAHGVKFLPNNPQSEKYLFDRATSFPSSTDTGGNKQALSGRMDMPGKSGARLDVT
jgi:hypothetical protein